MNRFQPLGGSPRSRLGIALLACLTGIGCGDKTGEVSGTVTYRGEPLPTGTLTFLDARKEAVGSSSITEGKYAMVKVPVGPVTILVLTSPVAKLPRLPPMGKKVGAKDVELIIKPPDPPPPRVVLPAKYSNPDESGLSYTVQPGLQTHDIELK